MDVHRIPVWMAPPAWHTPKGTDAIVLQASQARCVQLVCRCVRTRGGSRIFTYGGGGVVKYYVWRTHITSANPEVPYGSGFLLCFLVLSEPSI